MSRRFLCVLISLANTYLLWAGNPDKAMLERAVKTFPDNDAIYLQKNMYTTIELVKGELSINTAVNEEIYFPTDKSDLYRKYAVYHSFFTDVSDLQASTFANDGGKFREVKVEHFTTVDNVDANVFYDDLKEINFVFPGITAGSVGHVSYNEKLKDPHFFSPFYFVSYMPVLNSEYTIVCPASVKLKYRVFNDDSSKVKFSREERGRNVVYKWVAKNMKNPLHEESAPSFAYYAPHVLVTIGEYKADGTVKKVIPDLDGMCEWYGTFVKDINKGEDSVLSKIVSSLIKGVSSDGEKVKRIYYWVQDNINYVAFEDGMNGFVPREAEDICKKRYGDCKDMTSILVKMLKMAGIKAYYTWIGSRSLPYKYTDMPSPNIDNHMICIADVGQKRYVLDGTGKYTPLGFVTGFIQGKEGLLMKDDGSCEIYTIPVMPKESSVEMDTITVNFPNQNEISGDIKTDLSGYFKIDQCYVYHYSLPEKREEKFSDYLKTGNNKCIISNLHYQGFNGQDSTVQIQGHYDLPEYVKSIANKIYLNPNLEKEGQFDKIDLSDRTLPYEVEFKSIKKSVTIIDFPKGYKLDYKPDDTSFKGAHTGFKISYVQLDDKIVETKIIETDFLMLPLSELKDFNNMITAIDKAYKENIVFVKK